MNASDRHKLNDDAWSIASLHDHLRDCTITPTDCEYHNYEMWLVGMITKSLAIATNSLSWREGY